MPDSILKVENLTKKYHLFDQQRDILASDRVSFIIGKGESIALTGPSGAGKSSILNCIYRTCIPSEGKILFTRADQSIVDIATLPDNEMIQLRRSGEIGFVTQFLHCLPRKTAIEVVSQPLLEAGWKREDALDRAADQLQACRLNEKLWHLSPSTFSGGERQRVNLARGLVITPRLLLLDEPTASLDHQVAIHIMDSILNLTKQQNIAILSIFHDLEMIKHFAHRNINIAQHLS